MQKLGKSTAFTLIELLVVIAIIAILAAILFPVFARAKDRAWQTQCMSNGKQMAIAIFEYMSDNHGAFPRGSVYLGTGNNYLFWADLVDPYVHDKRIRECPSLGQVDLKGYPWAQLGVGLGMNVAIGNWATDSKGNPPPIKEASISRPADTVLLADGQYRSGDWVTGHWAVDGDPGHVSYMNPNGWPLSYVGYRHDGRANVIFADGHAKALTPAELMTNKSLPATDPNYSLWDFN